MKDENNWVDYALYLRAWETVEELSGDATVGFKVGRFNISRQNLGSMWPLLRAAGSLGGGTTAAYRLVPRLANQLSRSGQFAIESFGRRSVRLRWTQHDGYPFRRVQCDYRQGLLTAGPRLAGLPPAQIDERECLGTGGSACVYEVRFSPERAVAGTRTGAAVGLAGGVMLGMGGGGWLAGGLLAVAAVALGWGRDRTNRAAFTTETLSDQMEELMAAKQRLQADYDALRSAQQQLREKDRLASLGELSAKLAHELRNPLGIIKGSAQVIADERKPADVRREMTSYILDEVERMNASITNFLVFARAKTSHRTPTDVAAVTINIAPSDAGRFRVWVSDGIHTGSDISDGTFTVPNSPPEIAIVTPAEGTTVASGQTVAFQASVYDRGSGTLPAGRLEWRSDIDGLLGNGRKLSISDLSVGRHNVTFTADDGRGGVAGDQVTVVVVSDLSELPPPCSGDCDGDGAVSIAELIGGVTIALGAGLSDGCPTLDGDGDRQVSISELVAAVRAALVGCTPLAGSRQ